MEAVIHGAAALTPLGVIVDALLALPPLVWGAMVVAALLAAVGIGMHNARQEEASMRAWRKRERKSPARSTVGKALDYFQLDMSRYSPAVESGPGFTEAAPMNGHFPSSANRPSTLKVHDVGRAGVSQVEVKPGLGELQVYHASGFKRDQRVTSHWQLGLHPHMSEVIDLLKTNRRYEFPDMQTRGRGTVERLGASACGGLFAEVQFGSADLRLSTKSSLNPD